MQNLTDFFFWPHSSIWYGKHSFLWELILPLASDTSFPSFSDLTSMCSSPTDHLFGWFWFLYDCHSFSLSILSLCDIHYPQLQLLATCKQLLKQSFSLFGEFLLHNSENLPKLTRLYALNIFRPDLCLKPRYQFAY